MTWSQHFRLAGLIMLVAACAAPGIAMAQTDPAADAIRQNEQRALDIDAATSPAPQTDPILTVTTPAGDLPAPGGPTVHLKSVVFEPASAFLTAEELNAIAAPYVGRRLDFAAIAKLVRAVNDLYAERGIVTAGAVLPPQTLASGVLKIQLVEGRQGVVSIVGDRKSSDAYIFNRIQLTRGDGIVDVPAAADDIAFFNKTNRAQIRLLLQPGAAFGFTDLTLGIVEPPPHTLQFFLDNHGVRSTGEVQTGLTYQAYGLMGMDDTLVASLTASLGSIAGTISYDIPITTAGTRISLGYSRSQIRVVDGPSEPLDINGGSQVASLTASQPVFATTDWSLIALASTSYGDSISRAGVVSLVESTTTKASAGLALSYTGTTGSFSIQPQIVFAAAQDKLAQSWRDLTIGTISGSGRLQLGDSFAFVVQGAGQYAGHQTLLPGDLLFKIGGPNTVRGYPSDGVAGDSGYFVQSELHWNVAPSVDLFALTDFGQAFSTFPARTTMMSIGAGVSYTAEHFGAELAVAAPVLDAVADQQNVALYAKMTGTFY
ncbi:ShlB/FhaC/HecB family hemolysin secretion/activation protein [Devosia sp.]|uniref:ShlB/FhaC/HecB family hemolysin secretion/activation protein n=1 Tax=Devosia sp. TaxID=1871048 RepID=UPI002619D788|nr:ShlB/FhaC/HecB family hemolysin secretion/activation protein [Devosia sp.]